MNDKVIDICVWVICIIIFLLTLDAMLSGRTNSGINGANFMKSNEILYRVERIEKKLNDIHRVVVGSKP